MSYKGAKKHLKRTNAPKSYGLRKLGGTFAVKARAGPHDANSSIPLTYILRHILKYAQDKTEVKRIMGKKIVTINGRKITEGRFPVGFNDVLQISDKLFKVTADAHGRFACIKINKQQAQVRPLKVLKKYTTVHNVPMIQTSDGKHIRYPHPNIKINDTVVLDIKSNKITQYIPFKIGMTVFATGGNNIGRIGILQHTEAHPGSQTVVTVTDSNNNSFITLISNVMVIGDQTGNKFPIHKSNGLRLSHLDARNKLMASRGDITEEIVAKGAAE